MRPASRIGIAAALCLALGGLMGPARAALVTHQYQALGGNQWRAQLAIVNPGGVEAIEGLTVYFDPALFAQLSNPVAPGGWSPLVWQPEGPPLASPGAYDALADTLAAAVQPGQTLGGFSVEFTWLGTAPSPGDLPYEFYRLDGDAVVIGGSGLTRSVPVPAGAGLLLGGLVLLAGQRARSRRNAAEAA